MIIIFLGARLILTGEGFSVGMLFAFLSFRQTFNERAVGFINQLVQFRLLRPASRPPGRYRHRRSRDRDAQRRSAWTSRAQSRFASCRSATASPTSSCSRTSTSRSSPASFVAITGPSGGGKTTLLKLLLGLHRPTSGTIDLDGHRADPELWRAWRAHVGVVAQDDRLLSGTIADNIAFFDPDLDMARVQAAAPAAQVHDDIMRTPMQYLGLVGDMGSTLSGGQRQRVLLARALYGRPRVLLLDEGTANLDEETEETIADLIEQMPITRIVVAHRPALIRRANRVFVVKERQITEHSPADRVAPEIVAVNDVSGAPIRIRGESIARAADRIETGPSPHAIPT